MAVVKVWPGGSSGGFAGPGRKAGDGGAARGIVNGWSLGSSRRLYATLWSIDSTKLGEDGWAITLTVKDTPPNADEWHAARRAFQMRLSRAGIEQQQWVIEWTRKKTPHLHMAVFGPGNVDELAVVAWLQICQARGWSASFKAQHIVRITGANGWLQYVSKHAARGVHHYQREGAPEGWDKTGRLWGITDNWPRELPIEVELERWQFHRYRRLVIAYQRKRMIASGVKPYRALKLGTRFGDKESGAMMGVSGWIPDSISTELLNLAAAAEPRIDYRNWDNP